MSQDDVERVARAIYESDKGSGRLPWARLTELSRDIRRREARAALSALPPRLSPELIAKLNKLASRLTEQGEYEAVDLIDTVVERVSAMPGRFYWLIERSAPREFFGFAEGAPIYVCLIYGKPWTDKADEALRFSRREDATQYWHRYEARDPALRIVEHGDIPALPERELLREAMEALDRVLLDVEFMWEDGTLPNRRDDVIYVRARAAADKIRAALKQQQKGEEL